VSLLKSCIAMINSDNKRKVVIQISAIKHRTY